jgi:hypothetical protein
MSERLIIGESKPVDFVWQSVYSLGQDASYRHLARYRPVYEENASGPEELPLNTEGLIMSGIVQILRERDIQAPYPIRPYWNPSQRYNPFEVFGATIQCLDQHDAPLPDTVLPPEKDVLSFIKSVHDKPGKTTIPEQFSILLDITSNDISGAANLGWIANRFMARAADQRAYPNIAVSAETIRSWNQRVAQFETYDGSDTNDGPGDNYYFWTHVFGAMVYSQKGVREALAQTAFRHGTQIMMFVRKNIAKKPNITSHHSASHIGREIGLALAYPDGLVSTAFSEDV